MPPIGPIYCETPVGAFLFPAEPVNFYSNAIIVAFGLVALLYALRRRLGPDVVALAILLTLTGVGSFLWHGYRTPLSLALDVLPGLLFLFLFVYAWARRLMPVAYSVLFLGTFLVLAYALSYALMALVPVSGPPVGVVAAVVVSAAFLSVLSARRYGSIALVAVLSVAASLSAFGFRTIDLFTCDLIPFGTHFLWHIFLSLGAFLGIVFLVLVDRERARLD